MESRRAAIRSQKGIEMNDNVAFKGTGMVILAADVTGPGPDDEILSLLIADALGNVGFNSAFRPARLSDWGRGDQGCGIAPGDVADAPLLSERLGEVQAVIDAASEVVCYEAGSTFRLLREAGIEVDQGKIVDAGDCYSRAVALMEGSRRRSRCPLPEAAAAISENDALVVHDSAEAAWWTREIQKWSDSVELEVAQRSFIERWTLGPGTILGARTLVTAYAQMREEAGEM